MSTPLLLECPQSGCRRAWLLGLGDDTPVVELLLSHLRRSHRLGEAAAVDVVAALGLGEATR